MYRFNCVSDLLQRNNLLNYDSERKSFKLFEVFYIVECKYQMIEFMFILKDSV